MAYWCCKSTCRRKLVEEGWCRHISQSAVSRAFVSFRYPQNELLSDSVASPANECHPSEWSLRQQYRWLCSVHSVRVSWGSSNCRGHVECCRAVGHTCVLMIGAMNPQGSNPNWVIEFAATQLGHGTWPSPIQCWQANCPGRLNCNPMWSSLRDIGFLRRVCAGLQHGTV